MDISRGWRAWRDRELSPARHLVKVRGDEDDARYQIGNNRGGVNGWIGRV
jgi:hypothetical protein